MLIYIAIRCIGAYVGIEKRQRFVLSMVSFPRLQAAYSFEGESSFHEHSLSTRDGS